MRSKWPSALAALVVACAPSAAHGALMGAPLLGGSDWPTGPLLGFGAFAGAPTSSYTRVREGTDRGTSLYLQDDLGIPVIGEAQLQDRLVYVSQSVIDATAGLAWRASEGVQVVFGYRFLYLDIDEESTEDGNLVGVFTHGAFVTVQVVF